MSGPRPVLTAEAAGLGVLADMPDWLIAAADEQRWAAALQAAVPELASGAWRLTGCRPRLRLKDGGWEVSGRLELVAPDGTERTVALTGFCRPGPARPEAPVVVAGALGSSGWTAEIPALGLQLAAAPEDTGLPALADLTEAPLARRMLSRALGTEVAACRPEVMRYKAGSRCTVRYGLEYAPGQSGPATVIAKTYRGDKGANAFAGMTALDRAGIPGEVVALAPALAYDAERRVLIQGTVPEERTLKQVAQAAGATGDAGRFAALEAAVADAAAGLAALHASGVCHGEVVTWDDEHAELAELVDRVSPFAPELGAAIRPWLAAVAAEAARYPADPLGTAHRSFRPAQVLLSRAGVAFIDFDGLCTAEPAMDVALFRSSLRNAVLHAAPSRALEDRLVPVDRAADVFLERYLDRRQVSVARVRLWERLYLVTSVLHCWTKIQPARLPGRLAALERHVDTPLP